MRAGPHVVITGLMGAGKSTAAAAVAIALGRPVRDSDVDLHALFGRSGAELAAEHGVDELHRLEAAVLLGALAGDEPTVISAAGWVVEDPGCRRALARTAVTVVLSVPVDELVRRIRTGSHRRPVDRSELAGQAAHRGVLFDEVADVVIDAATAPDEVVRQVLDHFERLS